MVDTNQIREKIQQTRAMIDSINADNSMDLETRLQLGAMQERCSSLIQMLEAFLSGAGLG